MTVISSTEDIWASAVDQLIFQRALDALPDGVLLVNAARRIVYTNQAFRRLWSIPDGLLAMQDDNRTLHYVMDQLVDPESFRSEVERLHPTAEASEDELLFKDGRIISRRSLPFQEEGSFSARIWIFTDVTEARSASVDCLTQLPNRLAYARQFPTFATAPADGMTRSVAIVDVDRFKKYNDSYGHARGDSVLSAVGAMLHSHVHQSGDLAFRIGGEEFLMAIRTRRSSAAAAFFETVRKSIVALNLDHAANTPYSIVSVSIGYAVFECPQEPSALFARVDKALYRAKACGRNRIVEAHAE